MSDEFGQIETRGIDHVPAAERHGRPRELFAVWLAANVSHLYIVLGGAVILLGLTLWQAVGVIVVGNVFWVLVGWLSISGYASGTPSSVVMRAVFGVRGNRVLGAGLGWLICVLMEAINLVLGATAAFALAERAGVPTTAPLKAAILVLIAAATFALSVYGHATIVRFSLVLTVALALVAGVVGWFVLRQADWSYAPAAPLSGVRLWAALFAGFVLMVSIPLSWGNGADYARYLPERSSAKAVVWWTAAGGFLPSVALCLIGALAGTRVDMSDPQASLAKMLPGWLAPVLLALIVVGSIANNVLTVYSSGLSLQALGLRIRRAWSVLFDGALGGAVSVYALFVADSFLEVLDSSVQVLAVAEGPVCAIYAADVLLRRNRYGVEGLADVSGRSPHWHQGGYRLAGVFGALFGVGAGLLCAKNSVYEGPVVGLLDGLDLSVLVGSAIGLAAFLGLRALERRAQAPAVEPDGFMSVT